MVAPGYGFAGAGGRGDDDGDDGDHDAGGRSDIFPLKMENAFTQFPNSMHVTV